jgi:hypothetical protein
MRRPRGVGGNEVSIVPALATLVAEAEDRRDPPVGVGERFAGYGVMGLPFANGHVLAMRRFPASSIGPAYTSIWHRDPGGRWEFWQDQPDDRACPRYFSRAVADTRQVAIPLEWTGDTTLHLTVPELDFHWTATMGSSPVTRLLNAVGSFLPERAWTSRRVLSAMGSVAGAALRAGRVGLHGSVPNGHRFIANPLKVWLVVDTNASLAGEGLGPIGPLDEQARLADFWIPQRGVFALGRAFFSAPTAAS